MTALVAASPAPQSLHQFTMKTIDGKPMPMAQYKGKVSLVVNVASKCGLTPQYAGLEKLAENYRDRGLTVVGVPCNQFMGQEPGTEAEIAPGLPAYPGARTFALTAAAHEKDLVALSVASCRGASAAAASFTWSLSTFFDTFSRSS